MSPHGLVGGVDSRFRRHWDRWRARIKAGKTPADFIAECSDETLVELLADGSQGTPVERNVIATELTNRISRLHRKVEGHSDRVREALDDNERAAEAGGISDAAIRSDTDALQDATDKTSRYSKRRKTPREGGW